MTLASFGFDLSNREIAAIIYLSLLITFVLLRKKIRLPALNILRSFFAPNLTRIWLLMSLYVVASVCLLAWLNLWEWHNLKSTLLWWMTVGFASCFEAEELMSKPHILRKLVSDAFSLSAVVVFIAELVSFPLWIELIMLPSLTFLALLIAVGERQSARADISISMSLLRTLEMLAVTTILGFSYWLVASRVTEFWTLTTLLELGLPLLLWLLFVPFLFLLTVYMTYKDRFIYLQTMPENAPIARYVRWRALLAFGWNIDGVNRFARDIRLHDITEKQDIKDAIHDIKRLIKNEKNPPDINLSDGWSPQVARMFLAEYGLVTADYHRTPLDWFAHVGSVPLNDQVLPDRFSYYLTGNECAVTRLRLALYGLNQNDTNEAQNAFDERALTLLAKVFDAERATTIYARVKAEEPEALEIDGIRVSLNRPNTQLGDYVWDLIILHPMHKRDH